MIAENEIVENNFSCWECGKGFNDPIKFESHIKSHSTDKKVRPKNKPCDVCGMLFRSVYHVNRHKSKKHLDEGTTNNVRKNTRIYSNEEKLSILKHCIEHGFEKTSIDFDVPVAKIKQWKSALQLRDN